MQNIFLVVLGNSSNNGRQRRDTGKLMLLGHLGTQRVEVDVARTAAILGGFVIFDEGVGDVGAASQEALALGRNVGSAPLGGGDGGNRSNCSRRHDGRFCGRRVMDSIWFCRFDSF